ncbi:MAG: 3,4-dihydroxy-2-butanone-4-phosphate synthase [Cyanophyceae cyanobacterium]
MLSPFPESPVDPSIVHPVGADPVGFHPVGEAIDDLKSGRLIIVVDDENRENEGDLVGAAQFATPQMINFMATEARGLICLAMQGSRLDQLDIPLMVGQNTDHHGTAFTVSIDAGIHLGVSTGISASDRSRTIQATLNPATRPEDLRRPGHIFPLRAKEGGVLKRAGHTEAAVDLCVLAGLYPAGVICEIQNPDGSMSRLPQLMDYARQHDLKIITIASLIDYRLQHERLVQRQVVADLPSEFGDFRVYVYRDSLADTEHLAIVKGDPAHFAQQQVLVRVHSEDLIGDALGSLRTDSRRQLQSALKMIEYQGQGVVIYLRQEGLPGSLRDKIQAYALQDRGLEVPEPQSPTVITPILRNYGIGAQMLRDLGVRQMRLITNNPRKIGGLSGFGLEVVERVPLLMEQTDPALRFLNRRHKSGPAPQQLLLTIALYPKTQGSLATLQRALWMENLRRLAAAEELLIQEDPRAVSVALFGAEAVVGQVGVETEGSTTIPWYDGQVAGESRIPQALMGLLRRVMKVPDLEAVAWLVSDGAAGNPLDHLRQDLKQVELVPEDLAGIPQWQPKIIYRIPLS